jgi:hypothetical protein
MRAVETLMMASVGLTIFGTFALLETHVAPRGNS